MNATAANAFDFQIASFALTPLQKIVQVQRHLRKRAHPSVLPGLFLKLAERFFRFLCLGLNRNRELRVGNEAWEEHNAAALLRRYACASANGLGQFLGIVRCLDIDKPNTSNAWYIAPYHYSVDGCGRHKNKATITLYPETKSDYDARPGRCKVQTKYGKAVYNRNKQSLI